MPALPAVRLLARDSLSSGDTGSVESSTSSLSLTLLALLLIAIALSIWLLHLRRRRLAQEQALMSACHQTGRNCTFGPNEGILVYRSCPASSPVPEIRLTFPDDNQENGSEKHGRVVVVHVTDTGSEGMSPLEEEALPPYQRDAADRFQSLDLNRMGGLREKEAVRSQA